MALRTLAKRLLVVDDDLTIVFALREFFAHRGFQVDCASEASEAQKLLSANEYDVLITDLHITRHQQSEGLSLLSFAQTRSPSIGKILLTAFCSADLEKTAQLLGADRVLVKPIQLPLLSAIVHAILARTL